MGHRLVGHEGKCSMLHGHNYVGLFEASANDLDDVGRVIDFSVLKERIGGWIEERWDHGFLLAEGDVSGMAALATLEELQRAEGERPQKSAFLPYNPTAENIARYLGEHVCANVLADVGVRVDRVTVWETENCFATWERSR